jgi:hypothetical protein
MACHFSRWHAIFAVRMRMKLKIGRNDEFLSDAQQVFRRIAASSPPC